MKSHHAALVFLVTVSCGDDRECGAPETTLAPFTVQIDRQDRASFATLTSSANNDCPGDGTEVSLTLEGQSDDGARITLCVPDPEDIGDGALPLVSHRVGDAQAGSVELVDLFFDEDPCAISFDSSMSTSGTVTFAGFCSGTGDTFTVDISGTAPGTRTCVAPGGEPAEDSVALTLGGTALVTPTQM